MPTVGGTVTLAADYTLSSATITIAEGETQGAATITVIHDTEDDDGDTIVLDAENPALVPGGVMHVACDGRGGAAASVMFRGPRAAARVVERFTPVDAETIRYEFTVEDPTSWTSAWSAEFPMLRTDELMFEYACHEGTTTWRTS